MGKAGAAREWLLHVLLLFNLAIAQPLYAVLSAGATFFVVHAFTALHLLLFALAFSLAIPAALAALVLVLRSFGAHAFRAVQILVVWALSLLALLAPLSRLEGRAAVPLALGAFGASGLTALYARSQRWREFLRFASVVSVIFPVSFLFFSPVKGLLPAGDGFATAWSAVVRNVPDTPVFLIVFDELSTVFLVDEQGDIDERNFPNFARLAESATWYRNASANSTSTEVAVASILTGRHVDRKLLPIASAHPVNLFTLLAPDYEVVSFDHLVRLCPDWICHKRDAPSLDPAAVLRDLFVLYQHVELPKQLREGLPPLEGHWSNFVENASQAAVEPEETSAARANSPFARKAKKHFEAFLDSVDESAPSKLFFLHSLLPHVPYVFLPDGRSYASHDGFDTLPGWSMTDNLWSRDEDLVVRGYQRALLQTQMVDGLIGRFLDRLEAQGLLARSLIVITADHGSNFHPGVARRGFNAATWATGLMVPLFVKLPGQSRGARSDRNVQSIDVTPTILAALGRVPSDGFDGASVLDATGEPPKTKRALPWRGEPIDLPADLTPQLMAAAAHKQDLFGFSAGAADFYRLEPYGGLVGRALDRFELGPEQMATAQLDAPGQLERWDPSGDFVPASIEGTIEGDATALPSRQLAIALNGRFAAVAKLFEKKGQLRFQAIVPPELLSAEGNTTAFYSIAEAGPDGEGMRLFPLRPRATTQDSTPGTR